jgi:AraC-like DNA-binding protein
LLILIQYLHVLAILNDNSLKKILREISLNTNKSFIVKEEIAPQFAAPFHFHHGYELTFIVKGHGKFYGGDRLMNFKAGDMYLFGIGFPHYFATENNFVESGALSHSIVIQFSNDFLGHDFYLKHEFKTVKELLKTANKGIKIIKPSTETKELIHKLPKQTGLKALIILMQLLEMISTLRKSSIHIISSDIYKSPAINSEAENRLEAVYKYVLENFKEDVNTKTAASLVFMNQSAFCRYFKRRTNKTLSQFINTVRITHATYLLAEQDTSITKICFECGFDNLSYFNRQFKSITGKTPLKYRKEIM